MMTTTLTSSMKGQNWVYSVVTSAKGLDEKEDSVLNSKLPSEGKIM